MRDAQPRGRRNTRLTLSSMLPVSRNFLGRDGRAQLLGFGVKKHDDAVDALVYLILGLVGDGIEEQKVHCI
jgi:hypothetical protein